jgi:hypothetical protein
MLRHLAWAVSSPQLGIRMPNCFSFLRFAIDRHDRDPFLKPLDAVVFAHSQPLLLDRNRGNASSKSSLRIYHIDVGFSQRTHAGFDVQASCSNHGTCSVRCAGNRFDCSTTSERTSRQRFQ